MSNVRGTQQLAIANMKLISSRLLCVSLSCVVLTNGCDQRQDGASAKTGSQASPAGQGATATSAKAPSQSAPSKSSTGTLDWAEVIEAEVDPAVVTDAGFRDAIKATGLPWRVRDKGTNIEMLLIPPGEFVMGKSRGDDQADENELPAHEVTLTKAFYLGRYEVTQQQYARVTKLTPSWYAKFVAPLAEALMRDGATKSEAEAEVRAWKAPQPAPDAKGKEWPVECVSWKDCTAFCKMTGMRLPTEAEWEYACRAGTRTPTYGEVDEVAWWRGNSKSKTHAVGTKRANALGLHDMLGNVLEGVNDSWGDYSADPQTDPRGPSTGSYRVFRGGCSSNSSSYCRASVRNLAYPDLIDSYFGFRAARTP
jgi:formylglycine-generating enzyme required for sulfatase activity